LVLKSVGYQRWVDAVAVRGRGGPAEPGPAERGLTELILVRHGQGVCNAAGVIGGPVGCRGLSRQGVQDSLRLARQLDRWHADRLFDLVACSPRPRVLQCANIIGARLRSPVTVLDRLRGQDFGQADGAPWKEATEAFGGAPHHDPDRPIAAGAEPWNVYAARVLAALTELLSQRAGQRILVVGHGKTVGLAGALLSGSPDPAVAAHGFVVAHAELTCWHRQGLPPAWVLVDPGEAARTGGRQRTVAGA
jgi:2,3-bisphosphoglycerate-dependent phosphoglycerate mutase